MKAPRLALLFALASAGFVLLTTKAVVLWAPRLNGRNLVPGLLDISFAFNRGVSFSLLAQKGPLGSGLLVAFAAAIIMAFGIYAYRATRKLLGVALGLLIGGALGNAIDRALHGGVFDYLAVRVGAVPLFVCNMADIVITIGVLLLLVDLSQDNGAGGNPQL